MKDYKKLVDHSLVRELQGCITGANCHKLNGLIHSYYSVITAKYYGNASEEDIIKIEAEIENKIKILKSK